MSYQALYRVWRPQTFADVIGQTAITTTLKNALAAGQTSHAYLFAGPRGTGKTSVAKIMAKALNCEHLVDGEPDNTCASCVAINEGRLTDVIEFDAASNNGVDEIRNIIDKVKYAPTEARVKVYIIDEVHMLTPGAFNALLKTLEEPPAQVVFILATTDPQKIPATIISRTQRFDFRRITAADMVARMQVILADKGIDADEQALLVIARAAEGGMRDALSILDQVLSFSDNRVTLENALDVTGGVATVQLGEYLTAIAANDPAAALTIIEQLLAAGKDAGRLLDDLIAYLRDLLVYQAAPKLVNETQSALQDPAFKDLAGQFTGPQLYAMIDVLNQTQGQLRVTNSPTLYLEVATIQLSNASGAGGVQEPAESATENVAANSEAVAALTAQVQALQQTVRELANRPVGGAPTPPPVKAKAKKHQAAVNKKQIYPILGAATKADLTAVKDIWPDLLNMLSVTKRAMMNISEPVAASPDGVIVSFEYDILVERAMKDADLMTEMTSGLKRLMKVDKQVVLVQQDDWPKVRKAYLAERRADKSGGAEPAHVTPPDATVDVAKPLTDLFGADANIEIKND